MRTEWAVVRSCSIPPVTSICTKAAGTSDSTASSAVPVGEGHRLITLDDLRDVAEPAAALVLELPQRDLGGQLPDWDDLRAQVDWAHERGAVAHLDGARLWECGPAYGRPLAEIAALFDTVYVSLYKKLGGLSGCCLAGTEDTAAEVREWRRRHGGTLFALWPYAASDLAALRARLPRMAAYHEHAVAIGAALRNVPGVQVVPDPPQTSMMHLRLGIDATQLKEAAHRVARDEDLDVDAVVALATWYLGGRVRRRGRHARVHPR